MKFRLLLILTACLLMFSIWVVLAVVYLPNSSIIEQATNGYATPQASSKEIALVDTSCKKITTTTNTQYFVPTKTTVESSSFLANPPSGVSIDVCAPTAWVCGPTNGTSKPEYPLDIQACTSWAQTDVDSNGADGTYNWKCGTTSCSATVAPHCEWQYGHSDDRVTWTFGDIFLLPGNTEPSTHRIGQKDTASCSWFGWATCTDIDPSTSTARYSCSLPSRCSPGWSIYIWNGMNWDDYGSPTWVPSDAGVGYASNTQWPIIMSQQNLAQSIVATTWTYPWRANILTCAVYNWHITGWSPSPWPDSCYTKFWEYAGNISDGATCSVYHAPATCREGNKLYTIACVGPARVNGTCWCGIGTEDTWPSCLWWLITNISINQTTKSWEFTCQGYNGWTNTSCSEEIAPAWYVHDVWCINSSPSCDWWRYDTFDVSTWIWTHFEQRACADPWSRYQYTWIGTGWWNETYIDASAWTHICMNAC